MSTGFVLSKLTTLVTESGNYECVHLILKDKFPVAVLQKSCVSDDVTLYTVIVLNNAYTILEDFNWQTIKSEWRAVNPIKYNSLSYSISPSLNFRSQYEDIPFSLEGPRFKSTLVQNNQKRVIYLGYWLSDADIPTLVQNWKSANITHVLLTFILDDLDNGLYADTSMIPAFEALSPENQKLMLDNFIVGVSLGGAAAWPVPISKVYTEGKYKDDPTLFKTDLLTLIPKNSDGTYAFSYFDFDLEGLEQNIDVNAFSSFFGTVAQDLKTDIPGCLISHAPQTPYFTDSFQNVYTQFYTQYKDVIDFFNIQYYNNGLSNTFEQIFINSDSTDFPGVAVAQLIQKGIPGRAIVVGKPVNASEGSQGYVPLNPITESGTLANDVQQAFLTSSLAEWATSGGVMIWYYNTQVTLGNGTYLSPYIQTVYSPVSTKDAVSDDENILDFFTSISALT